MVFYGYSLLLDSLDILLNKIFYLPLNSKQKRQTGFRRRCENDDKIVISYSYNKAADWIYHELRVSECQESVSHQTS